jgi:hypothetical protein
MIGSIGVALAALFYAAIGAAALLRPQTLLSHFDLPAETRNARNEIRAVYGGLPLAIAGLLLFALVADTAFRPGMLAALAIVSLGMPAGRLVSALADGGIGRVPALFAGLELLGAGAIAAGLLA